MSGLPEEFNKAIENAIEEDELRTAEGALAALPPCVRHCNVCEGVDHHWLPECDEKGPLMVCKHCPAWHDNPPDADDDDEGIFE